MIDAIRDVREMSADPTIFHVFGDVIKHVDVVMYNHFAEVASFLPESRGLPCVRVQGYPTEPCRSYSLVNPRRNEGTWKAFLTHGISNLMMSWSMDALMNEWQCRLGISCWRTHKGIETIYQFSTTLNPVDPA